MLHIIIIIIIIIASHLITSSSPLIIYLIIIIASHLIISASHFITSLSMLHIIIIIASHLITSSSSLHIYLIITIASHLSYHHHRFASHHIISASHFITSLYLLHIIIIIINIIASHLITSIYLLHILSHHHHRFTSILSSPSLRITSSPLHILSHHYLCFTSSSSLHIYLVIYLQYVDFIPSSELRPKSAPHFRCVSPYTLSWLSICPIYLSIYYHMVSIITLLIKKSIHMFRLGISVGSDVMNRYIQPSCFTCRCDLCDCSDVCLVVVYAPR